MNEKDLERCRAIIGEIAPDELPHTTEENLKNYRAAQIIAWDYTELIRTTIEQARRVEKPIVVQAVYAQIMGFFIEYIESNGENPVDVISLRLQMRERMRTQEKKP